MTTLKASCPPSEGGTKPSYEKLILYTVEYPFNFESQRIRVRKECSSSEETDQYLDMSFSSSPQFYVATGVLSFLYSVGCLVVYIFGTRHYETNPLIPVIDLAATGVLTIFWLAGSCAWAAGVSDVKFYTNPDHLIKQLTICSSTLENCQPESPGKWASLNISLVCLSHYFENFKFLNF